MKKPSGPIALLCELMLIMAVSEGLVLGGLALLPPGTGTWAANLLNVVLLLLLAGPLVYWRSMALVRSLRATGRVAEQSTQQGGLTFGKAVALTAGAQALGLLATVGGVLYLQAALDQTEQLQFAQHAARIKAEVTHRFAQPMYGLAGLRSSYGAKLASGNSTPLTQTEFEAAVSTRDLPREFPGVSAFGFLERVQRADTDTFVQRIQAEWGPQFAVRSSGTAADLLVVTHVAPLEGNRIALGFDVAKSPFGAKPPSAPLPPAKLRCLAPFGFCWTRHALRVF